MRAAVINMSSLLGSVELNWGEGANIILFPCWTSKRDECSMVCFMVVRCASSECPKHGKSLYGWDGILCMVIHPGWVCPEMGGSQAPLSPEESASSMLAVIGGLSEKDHGWFLNFTGEVLPW